MISFSTILFYAQNKDIKLWTMNHFPTYCRKAGEMGSLEKGTWLVGSCGFASKDVFDVFKNQLVVFIGDSGKLHAFISLSVLYLSRNKFL